MTSLEKNKIARYKKFLPDTYTDTEKNEIIEKALTIMNICFDEYIKIKK